ncbi:MAG: glycosyltransferase family 4 protein [Caldilineaceae bacterium]|nr:glycosyltransferase family 4 protein [Caldilineaceae bacterium]
MMQPIPILYLDHAPIWGGAEAVLINLLSEIDHNRFRPLVATPAEGFLAAPLRRAGIEQAHVTFGRLNEAGILLPLHLARAVWQVAYLARKENAAIIHSNTVRTHIVGALVGALTGIPVVWTIHDNTFPPGLFRRLSAIPRRIIAVSGWLAATYGGAANPNAAAKMTVIPNGLRLRETTMQHDSTVQRGALRAELGIPAQAPLILSVGRLVKGKAPHLFIEAACDLLAARTDAHFVLVGGTDPDDPDSVAYAATLDALVQASGHSGRLHMVGHRADVERFYADADLFVYCAVQPEGLPTVILEAMQYQLPVIASAIGGAQEIVEDGIGGRLVAAGDRRQLTAAIVDLLDNASLRGRMAAAGLARLREVYSPARQLALTQALYAELINVPT